jgi:glycosyltransferase involved in cell wall biosynthesis
VGIEISVAMGTYNGAAYLAEQLQSIAAQNHLPDELVVSDDASTDDTAAIVRDYAARAPFEVRLETNGRNLGSTLNFARAVSLCRGKVVFLADQDDFWLTNKVQRLCEVLSQDPGLGFAFTDANRVDRDRRPLRCTLWQTLPFPPADQRRFNAGAGFELLLRRNVVTGMTMAFRAEYLDVLLPIPSGWVHDGWIALLLAAMARARAVAEPLVLYRQHSGQQIGARPESLLDKYRRRKRQGPALYQATAENYAAALERLQSFGDLLPDRSVLDALARKIDHWRTRARIRVDRLWRLPIIAREVFQGAYGRYSSGWKSAAEDLLL